LRFSAILKGDKCQLKLRSFLDVLQPVEMMSWYVKCVAEGFLGVMAEEKYFIARTKPF
jgi:hypothetical protein